MIRALLASPSNELQMLIGMIDVTKDPPRFDDVDGHCRKAIGRPVPGQRTVAIVSRRRSSRPASHAGRMSRRAGPPGHRSPTPHSFCVGLRLLLCTIEAEAVPALPQRN